MSAARAFDYWKAITPLESSEMLNDIHVDSFQNMKKGARKKFENKLRKQSMAAQMAKKSVLTTEQIVNRLMG